MPISTLLLPKKGRPAFNKGFQSMTTPEKKSFQHSYDRHAEKLGLPPWRGRRAEVLRQQFNGRLDQIRQNAHAQNRVEIRKMKVGGRPEKVRYYSYKGPDGKKYYYYETLGGAFVSGGVSK
jgi:hypothetical protein